MINIDKLKKYFKTQKESILQIPKGLKLNYNSGDDNFDITIDVSDIVSDNKKDSND